MPHYQTTTARRELIDWSPYIRLIHDYPEVGSRGTRTISPPNIGDHAFHYFYSGTGKYQLSDNIYEIEPDCLFIARPGSPFRQTTWATDRGTYII